MHRRGKEGVPSLTGVLPWVRHLSVSHAACYGSSGDQGLGHSSAVTWRRKRRIQLWKLMGKYCGQNLMPDDGLGWGNRQKVRMASGFQIWEIE